MNKKNKNLKITEKIIGVSQGQGGTFQRVKRPAHMLSMGYIAGMNFVVTCLVAGPLFMVAINWMRQGEIEWRLPTNVLEYVKRFWNSLIFITMIFEDFHSTNLCRPFSKLSTFCHRGP